jgi:hypothetical protein
MGKGLKLRTYKYTEEEFEKMYQEAVKRGEERRRTEPCALSAKYDRKSNRLVLELHNKLTLFVPCDLLQGLRGAKPELISEVELWSDGAALHWEKLDADFRVESLLQGTFGGKTWMEALRKGRDPIKALAKHQAALARERSTKNGKTRKPKAA